MKQNLFSFSFSLLNHKNLLLHFHYKTSSHSLCLITTMSLGYAEKLSFIEDVGNVGMTEHFDSSHVLREKVGPFFSFIHLLLIFFFSLLLTLFCPYDHFSCHVQFFLFMLMCSMITLCCLFVAWLIGNGSDLLVIKLKFGGLIISMHHCEYVWYLIVMINSLVFENDSVFVVQGFWFSESWFETLKCWLGKCLGIFVIVFYLNVAKFFIDIG